MMNRRVFIPLAYRKLIVQRDLERMQADMDRIAGKPPRDVEPITAELAASMKLKGAIKYDRF